MQDTQGYNYAPFPICPHAQGHNHHPVVDTGYIMGEIADLEFGTLQRCPDNTQTVGMFPWRLHSPRLQ